jgi:hypothetical protein
VPLTPPGKMLQGLAWTIVAIAFALFLVFAFFDISFD